MILDRHTIVWYLSSEGRRTMESTTVKELKGWCKACGEVRGLDREVGCCRACRSPHVSSRRPASGALLLEEAA